MRTTRATTLPAKDALALEGMITKHGIKAVVKELSLFCDSYADGLQRSAYEEVWRNHAWRLRQVLDQA